MFTSRTRPHFWGRTFLRLGLWLILLSSAVVALVGCEGSYVFEAAPPPTGPHYAQIRVVLPVGTGNQFDGTTTAVYNPAVGATLTLEVSDTGPLTETTDSEGIVIFHIDKARVDQVGNLTIQYGDYEYTKTLVLRPSEDDLTVELGRGEIVFATPTPDVQQAATSIQEVVDRAPVTSNDVASLQPTAVTVLNESFADNARGWVEGDYSFDNHAVKYEISDGRLYQIVTYGEQGMEIPVAVPADPVQNFTFAIEASVTNAIPSGLVYTSLIFRQQDADNYYMVRFSSGGWYVVTAMYQGQKQTLQAWQQHDAIKTGTGQTNRFEVRTEGTQLMIYANDQQLTHFESGLLTAAGTFALATDGQAGQHAIVAFDAIEVTDLGR